MDIMDPVTGKVESFYRKSPLYTQAQVTGDNIVFRHGHIAITNYYPGKNFEFEKSLSVWDKVNWQYNQMAGYYVEDAKEFRLPRSFDTGQLAKFFPKYKPMVDNASVFKSDKIDMSLVVPPRDDEQLAALSFLCAKGDFEKNARFTTLMLALSTGTGKTMVSVAASAYLQSRVVVFVPISKLVEQWKKSFLDFTTVREDEILCVQSKSGSKSIDKCEEIREGLHEDKKVFIFMIPTVRNYVEQYGDRAAMEMFAKTKAYLKISDEIHKELKANCMIDALCNFHMNYYLSATPKRSDSKQNWIFRNCFKNCPRFGENFKTKEEKWTNIMISQYSFTPTPMQTQRMIQKSTKWLNSKLYEKELIHAPDYQRESFDNSLRTILNWSKKQLKGNNKILILCASIEGTKYVENIAKEFFPKQTSRYVGGMKPKEQKAAVEKQVICATSQSLGTGADIRGIQHVYMIGTYANAVDAGQMPGRARKLDDGTPVVYIEFVNFGWYKTTKQFERRKPYLIKASKLGKLFMIE